MYTTVVTRCPKCHRDFLVDKHPNHFEFVEAYCSCVPCFVTLVSPGMSWLEVINQRYFRGKGVPVFIPEKVDDINFFVITTVGGTDEIYRVSNLPKKTDSHWSYTDKCWNTEDPDDWWTYLEHEESTYSIQKTPEEIADLVPDLEGRLYEDLS